MTIGRTEKRDIPWVPTAKQGRSLVADSFAVSIWASGHRAATTGRTHESTRPGSYFFVQHPLHSRGRPHMEPLIWVGGGGGLTRTLKHHGKPSSPTHPTDRLQRASPFAERSRG